MTAPDAACFRCARVLLSGEGKRVPSYVIAPFTVAMAFLHGGLWFQSDLSRLYCGKCRALIVSLVLVATLVILTIASAGVALWLRGP